MLTFKDSVAGEEIEVYTEEDKDGEANYEWLVKLTKVTQEDGNRFWACTELGEGFILDSFELVEIASKLNKLNELV